MKKAGSLEAVYIYIYIVAFYKTSLITIGKLCFLDESKRYSFFLY